MLIRIISSIVGLPILIFLTYEGGLWLKVLVLVLSFVGMLEYYNAVKKKYTIMHMFAFVAATIYIMFMNTDISLNFSLLLTILIILLMSTVVIFYDKKNFIDAALTLFGFIYVCYLMSHIILVRESIYGEFFVWLIFIAAWGSDTGAYFSGITFGKHKLIPKLSPKKTVEGAIGGVAFTALLGFLYGLGVSKIFDIEQVNMILLCTVFCVAGAVFAMFGDLAASSIKRATNIKDFGKVIPGHGGVLDRFDSILFTAPAIYIAMVFMLK